MLQCVLCILSGLVYRLRYIVAVCQQTKRQAEEEGEGEGEGQCLYGEGESFNREGKCFHGEGECSYGEVKYSSGKGECCDRDAFSAFAMLIAI